MTQAALLANQSVGGTMPTVTATVVIAMVADKGGVGKTTSAVNTAAWLARYKGRTLFVDTDPSAYGTSIFLGLAHANNPDPDPTLYDVLCTADCLPEEVIVTAVLQPNGVKELRTIDVIPSHPTVEMATAVLQNAVGREMKLRLWLSKLKGRYDYIVIDTPPKVTGPFTLNALFAADRVVLNAEPVMFALQSLPRVEGVIEEVSQMRAAYGMPPIIIQGVCVTRFDKRLLSHREAQAALEVRYAGKSIVVVPARNAVERAAEKALDLFAYECGQWGDATQAFAKLAQEVTA